MTMTLFRNIWWEDLLESHLYQVTRESMRIQPDLYRLSLLPAPTEDRVQNRLEHATKSTKNKLYHAPVNVLGLKRQNSLGRLQSWVDVIKADKLPYNLMWIWSNNSNSSWKTRVRGFRGKKPHFWNPTSTKLSPFFQVMQLAQLRLLP